MKRDFYVYLFFRPDGRVCYVGKGHGSRWKVFEHREKNKHLQRIINNAGGSLPSAKVKDGLTEAEAYSLEINLIISLGRGKYGPLVNLTDGGEGRDAPITKENIERLRLFHIGRHRSIKTRHAIRDALRGKPKSKALVLRAH